ncbi:MAG: hypothetical protein ACI9VR_004016 [Cognaticolwellia sp.]|jgi:hypothetical protein
MLIFLISCLQFPDTDAPTADSSDTGSVGGCPSGLVEADAETVLLNNFSVDGLPLYGVAERLCVSTDGLSMQADLLIGEEPGSIALSSAPGSVNLPDDGVQVTLVQESTWTGDDIYAGTATLSVSSTEVFGDLQFEATNSEGDQINFGMSWSAEL